MAFSAAVGQVQVFIAIRPFLDLPKLSFWSSKVLSAIAFWMISG